jgi:hypothetical protein
LKYVVEIDVPAVITLERRNKSAMVSSQTKTLRQEHSLVRCSLDCLMIIVSSLSGASIGGTRQEFGHSICNL